MLSALNQSQSLWNQLTIKSYREVTSTNDLAHDFARNNPNQSALFIAKAQTQGRGRRGRSFFSNLQEGLYCSLLISDLEHFTDDIAFYTIIAATSVARALEQQMNSRVTIKWVNDIFYRGHKVCGILSETVYNPREKQLTGVVIGIGLNLAGDFSKSDNKTKQVAGTLFDDKVPDDFDTFDFLESIINEFDVLMKLSKKEIISIYQQYMLGLNQLISFTYEEQATQGTIKGITEAGHLLVELQDGTLLELMNNEISLGSEHFMELSNYE